MLCRCLIRAQDACAAEPTPPLTLFTKHAGPRQLHLTISSVLKTDEIGLIGLGIACAQKLKVPVSW